MVLKPQVYAYFLWQFNTSTSINDVVVHRGLMAYWIHASTYVVQASPAQRATPWTIFTSYLCSSVSIACITMEQNHEDLKPFMLFGTSPGSFSLILNDNHMISHQDTFAQHGHEGGGYDWDSIARTVLRLQAPHLDASIKFDPEAGMFCAYGSDEAALRELGLLLLQVYRDGAKMVQIIEAVDPDDWD